MLENHCPVTVSERSFMRASTSVTSAAVDETLQMLLLRSASVISHYDLRPSFGLVLSL